jgi:hypothetical protein
MTIETLNTNDFEGNNNAFNENNTIHAKQTNKGGEIIPNILDNKITRKNKISLTKFNFSAIKLDSTASLASVNKRLDVVPVRKPKNLDFFRIREGDEYMAEVGMIKTEDGEYYLATPEMYAEYPNHTKRCFLFTYLTRQGVIALWAIRAPGDDDKLDPWNRSALKHVLTAQSKWIRIESDQNLGAYVAYEAESKLSEPEWPNYSFEDLIEIAFKDRTIENMDHPVIKTLRGV